MEHGIFLIFSIDSLLRSLSFIGFKQVNPQEQALLEIDKEFVVSKYKLNAEDI